MRSHLDLIADLLEALYKARETIAALHGEPGWDIYEKNSPEMRLIDVAIAKAEGR
jgi:hypothetical protein